MASIVILTSSKTRHKFFSNTLANEFDVVGIVSEEKVVVKAKDISSRDEVISRHFFERQTAEKKYFGDHEQFEINDAFLLKVENGRTNDTDIFEWVKAKNPDFVILFGSSIIKPPLLSYYDGKMVNMHLGLSPYYRGSGTNFWPLVNNQPECVGATIHLAILKVDAGSILGQVRPEIKKNDQCHDFGCKTVINGTKKMIQCIHDYKSNKIIPQEQNLNVSQVCKRADFNAQVVVKMWNNFKQGMVREYIKNKEERDSIFPIVD